LVKEYSPLLLTAVTVPLIVRNRNLRRACAVNAEEMPNFGQP
jgi:hypothetical protein